MFEQIILPYAYDALEPSIDALTVETHYGKHHATYTKNFNEAVAEAGLQGQTAEEILTHLEQISDSTLRTKLRNNGGGYYNHNLYFEMLSPTPIAEPTGALAAKINETFGSFDALKEKLITLAQNQFGSGWAFLSANKNGELQATASPNQDNPLSEGTGFTPILALDVWEHAYYLKYKNLRADYLTALISLIDWAKVSARYDKIVQK